MYTRYFGLRDAPFSATPDPRFFYANRVYREAFATLLYGIRERKGLIVLTGEVGTGKTTLLRRLMDHLGATVRFVFFYNTTLTFDELVDFACAELELPVDGLGRVQKLRRLNDFLLDEALRGGRVVLLVDEAQHLGPDVLENLRLISNLETSTGKLLQIVLVGQPELEAKLADPALRQVTQRIAVRYRLTPLAADEIEPFIRHRLARAGRPRQDLFAPDAVRRVAAYARGIPRLVNILCDNALLLAYGSDARRVTAAIVDEVATDLGLRPPPPAGEAGAGTRGRESAPGRRGHAHRGPRTVRRWWRRAAVAAATVLVVAGAWAGLDAAARLGPAPGDPRRSLEAVIDATVRHLRAAAAAVRQAGVAAGPVADPAASPAAAPAAGTPPPTAAAVAAGPGAARPPAGTAAGAAAAAEPPDPAPDLALPERAEAAWTGRPVVVTPGATVSEIVVARYGSHDPLVLDLVEELNPHIDDLDRIVAGQSLRLPALTREALLRRESAGGYRLILTALPTAAAAAHLADTIRRAGFTPVVTPRPVTPTRTFYRVEIAGLPTRRAAIDAWAAAGRHGWRAGRDAGARSPHVTNAGG